MQTAMTYVQLDPRLSAACQPTPVMQPQWLAVNTELAEFLGVPEALCGTDAGAEIFAGNRVPDWAQPHALAYAGHQFANYVPQLGDGRAVLLTEVIAADGERYDIQLKGSGRTPYSRGGDGRAPIGPVLREYVLSEAMYRLGVPTTRALAAVATGELVHREEALPGAVITRVAKSHLRVGTAQFVLAYKDRALLQKFADYVIQRHYPACADAEQSYLALLQAVIDKQAQLIAKWMSLGFIHGVMNTDNMTLSGETIDYGPCAFMEAYDPQTVFSFIDRRGRYMYQNQPPIAMWNLARFAETLLPLISDDKDQAINAATSAVQEFESVYQNYYWQQMTAKIGLTPDHSDAQALVEDFLGLLEQHSVDFTLAFRALGDADTTRFATLFNQPQQWQAWYQRWQDALPDDFDPQQLQTINPAFIPRNHLVEQLIDEAVNEGSLTRFNRLNQALREPFNEREEYADLMRPAQADEAVTRTFCGT
ncbi:protein adenylyltransferase SelO [Pseudidiomarina insulisalsae]|uniref:Protein nucleotidyltransferase YdiU n=1 Tax=Pseudidiomarina insulisalsae TaxID=575789 RepID=A0A432YMQ9_9GAMM|nr:YdiU family protein [Pseudidiomarina insulisalsae]RUO62279.1 YdiU family protein [Pseudidiomarina insulisalsae]